MTVYAPSDHSSIFHPLGCGQQHDRPEGATRLAVTCPACEPHILAMNTGWSANPDKVALTPDEISAADAKDQVAKRERDRMMSDPATFGAQMMKAWNEIGGTTPTSPSEASAVITPQSLIEAALAMSPEDRKALAAILTVTPVDGETPPSVAPARRAARPAARAL